MEKLCPKCCLSCPHRLDVYMALLDNLEQFFDLAPDENDRVDALVIHGIAAELLKECGIVNQGYNLLASALTYAVLDPTLLQNLKGHLYPKIASLNHTTATRVERNIRTSIEGAWTHGDVSVLSKYFGNTIMSAKGKPTNLQFLLVMSDIVHKRCIVPHRHPVK